MWYIQILEYSSKIKIDHLLVYASSWKILESIMLMEEVNHKGYVSSDSISVASLLWVGIDTILGYHPFWGTPHVQEELTNIQWTPHSFVWFYLVIVWWCFLHCLFISVLFYCFILGLVGSVVVLVFVCLLVFVDFFEK